MRPIRAAVLLSFLSKSFSRHSFSYARVKISECATGATVHYTQVSTRDNRPCMRAVCQIIPRYVNRQIFLISSNLKYRKMLSKGGDIGPYFQDQHIRKEGKISGRLVKGRSSTVKKFPDSIVT